MKYHLLSPYDFVFKRGTCGVIDLKPNEIKGEWKFSFQLSSFFLFINMIIGKFPVASVNDKDFPP